MDYYEILLVIFIICLFILFLHTLLTGCLMRDWHCELCQVSILVIVNDWVKVKDLWLMACWLNLWHLLNLCSLNKYLKLRRRIPHDKKCTSFYVFIFCILKLELSRILCIAPSATHYAYMKHEDYEYTTGDWRLFLNHPPSLQCSELTKNPPQCIIK